MCISIIAAMDRCGLIGDEAGMPWRLSGDLRRFRALTLGKPIIVGWKTFALLGKPLPGRLNIVLTRTHDCSSEGCRVARTLADALAIAEGYLAEKGGDEVMIIGGGQVYAQAIERWDRCYLTVVEGQFAGTAFFPLRELLRQVWRPVGAPETHGADEKNSHRYSFHIIERVREAGTRGPQPEQTTAAQGSSDPEVALEGLDLAALLARGTVGP